ncbi:hypothetical protein [Dactylosporangium sp. CA-139066]|uniref:hypothetical protein n=1 Tax=Dactylosporangium sp. CA-139066 TaxID=3239930 RepID=UPI003D8DB02B
MTAFARRAGTLAVLAAAPLLLSGAPAWAHEHGAPAGASAPDVTAVFVRCLALLGVAVAAGLSVSGRPGVRRWTIAAAVTGAVAELSAAPSVVSALLAAAVLALPWLPVRAAAAVGAAAGLGVVLPAAPLGPLTVVLLAGLGCVALQCARPAPAVGWPQAAAAAGAVAVAVSLAGAPQPPDPGVPMLRTVAVGAGALPVFVTPQAPGWNLVHFGAEDVQAGLDPGALTPARARPGTAGSWALVNLPAGRSRLWIARGGATGSLKLDTGRTPSRADVTTDDGPECASAALGAVLAGSRERAGACPAQELTRDDAGALRAMVAFVAGRHAAAVSVVSDGSPRGAAARAVVESAARAAGLPVTGPGEHPLFVLSGWAAADATLRDVGAGRVRAQGSYLAPWLLNGPLLTAPSAPLLPLRFDVHDSTPSGYLAALTAAFPGEAPTGVGYTSWMRRHDVPAGPLRLYAASQLFVPGDQGHDHQHSASWVPSGTVTAVTGRLA